MKKIIVTSENCEEVAKELVDIIFDKQLTIVSFYTLRGGPKTLTDVVSMSGFTFKNGLLKISLTPIRSILWDISKEKVSLTYEDNGTILLERILNEKEIIHRVIVCR